ncbi:LysR substrate-binding domain-containing protein [Streptomyces sp. NBC_01317]|uniref:LysR substrate-binding domain-containing protein n=1 Tax=Streptomyces sp. NBC_01317 TaxID=2903822 RepID=UPI002E113136
MHRPPLFDALSSFHRDHPGVGISLFEDTSDRLTERVRGGTADLALIGTADSSPPGLEALPIVSERLIAAVPPGHPLTARARVTLADVSAYALVCLPEGTGIRAVWDRACAAGGVRPDIALQAGAPSAVADLASRGLGVAVLSESMVVRDDGLEARVIDDIGTRAMLALVHRTDGSAALRELLTHCHRSFLPAVRATSA